jgi:toxin HigB-1
MQIGNRGTHDIFDGINSAAARRTLPPELHAKAAGLLDRLNAATSPDDLRTPASNRLEKLRGARKSELSLWINDRYRICVTWTEEEAQDVKIEDYH